MVSRMQPQPTRKDPALKVPEDVRVRVMPVIDEWQAKPGALLPILHGVQDTLGYLPADVLALIADELNLSRAEVHGMVTFYHHFRTEPAGRHVVRVCRAEACQALGARALEHHAKASLGIDFRQTTKDGAITLEAVYCLGNCGCGPSVLVDDKHLHARVDQNQFDQLVAELRETT